MKYVAAAEVVVIADPRRPEIEGFDWVAGATGELALSEPVLARAMESMGLAARTTVAELDRVEQARGETALRIALSLASGATTDLAPLCEEYNTLKARLDGLKARLCDIRACIKRLPLSVLVAEEPQVRAGEPVRGQPA